MRAGDRALKRNIILRNRPLPILPIRPIHFPRPLIWFVVAIFFLVPVTMRIRSLAFGQGLAGLKAVFPFLAFDVVVVIVHRFVERLVGIPILFANLRLGIGRVGELLLVIFLVVI